MDIKEKIKQFGILAVGFVRTGTSKKNVQRLGIMVLGLGLMFGVSQASNLRRAVARIIGGEAAAQSPTVSVKNPAANSAATTPATTAVTEAETTDTEPAPASAAPSIVDLIGDSEIIVRGMVTDVTDGFENGLPYTQVTVQVNEALRGEVGEEYTFRQFGLKEPRKLDNGKVYLGTTPEGWSKYAVGEDAMLFLYKAASMTGLRTTVGLGQGKVTFEGGNAVSQAGNEGLFENVDVDAKLLNDKDKRLLATKKGAVNADGFLSFVRRAVKNKWVEGGKMRHVKK